MARLVYASDLTQKEWFLLQAALPARSGRGRPRAWPFWRVLNAIFYVLRTGCAWRYLPPHFPPWQTVYYHWRQMCKEGTWEQVNGWLRRQVRLRAGRNPEPSAGMIDSQSVRTTESGGPRGYDGAKQLSGRKRHILVDTLGLLLTAVVHPADWHDRQGGRPVLMAARQDCARLTHIWADQAYAGQFAQWAQQQLQIECEVVYPWWRNLKRYFPEQLEASGFSPGFHVLPHRWIVERTFGWLGRNRRLSKDYESLEATTEAWLYAAMSRLMLRRLA